MPDLKLVAADVDGTFVRSDYTYDKPRFARRVCPSNDQDGVAGHPGTAFPRRMTRG